MKKVLFKLEVGKEFLFLKLDCTEDDLAHISNNINQIMSKDGDVEYRALASIIGMAVAMKCVEDDEYYQWFRNGITLWKNLEK